MKLKRNSIESYSIILDDGREISMKKPNFDKKTNKYWCALPESVMEILGRKTIVVQSDDVGIEIGESKDVNEFFGRKSSGEKSSGEKSQKSLDPTKLPKVSNNFSNTIEMIMEEFDNEEDSQEFYRLYLIAKKNMDTKAIRKQIEELQKKLDELTKEESKDEEVE